MNDPRRRFAAVLFGVCAFASASAEATVTVEFQFGGIDPAFWPVGVPATGVLVADASGDGFLSPFHPDAEGTVLEAGTTVGTSDDVIVAVFPLQALADWGSRRGFAAAPPPIDYDAMGLEEGDSLVFYAFPQRSPGDALPSQPVFGEFRTESPEQLVGTMGFALPPDGGAYQLAVFDGGPASATDLSAFGTGPARVRLEQIDGTALGNGADMAFGTQSVGYAVTQTIRVRNLGGSRLTGLALQLAPGAPGDFAVAQPLSATEVDPGQTATFSVSFDPEAPGVHEAELELASNAPVDGNNLPLAGPYLLHLAGSGRTDRRTVKDFLVPAAAAATPSTSVTPRNWDDALAGTYDGLLRSPAEGPVIGAISPLVLSRKAPGAAGGVASATVRMNGLAAVVRGTFGADGRWQANVRQRDGSIMALDLQLEETNTTAEEIRGTVTWKGTTAQARLSRLTAPPAEWVRPYTAVFPSAPGWGGNEPGGDGWASGRISATGVVTLAGILGDGTAFTETAYLSKDLEFPLFSDLYRSTAEGRGSLSGMMTCRDEPGTSDFDGRVRWRKLADTRELRYGGGFDVDPWCLGSALEVSDLLPRILPGLADAHPNAELSFIGPTAPLASPDQGATDRVLSWRGDNLLIHYGPESLRGSASRTNGRLGGTFTLPGTRTVVRFAGVAFQKQDLAAGTFVSGLSSGALRIQPGTTFSYPGSEGASALAPLESPTPASPPPTTATPQFEAAAAGIYQGTLLESGSAVGFLESLSLTATRAFSGAAWIDGVRHVLRGTFAEDGTLTGVEVPPLGFLDLALEREDGTTDGYRLTGTLGTMSLDAQRRPLFTTAAPAPQAGRYTLAMLAPDGIASADEPAGDGAGNALVNALGACTGLVTLADGVRVTLAGHVSRSGEWSMNRGLYPRNRVPFGFLSGKLTFRDTPGTDLDGTWHWKRPDGLVLYPAGFATSRSVLGSRYTPPASGLRAFPDLDPALAHHNIWIRFAASSLGDLDETGTWTTTNRVLHFGPEQYVISFDPRTGVLGGTYADPTRSPRPTARFGGVILQKQGLVTGWHVSGPATDHGLFRIEKRDAVLSP
jgi:hypothetical protein